MNDKRIAAVVLAFFAFFAFNSAMAYDFQTGGVYYKIIGTSPNRVAVTNSGAAGCYTGSVVIPDSVSYNGNTYSVTEIADSAFLECRSLTAVSLPSTLTRIGVRSFKFCSRLSEVVVPEGVTTIEQYAFDGSNFTSVTLPASLSVVSVRAFDRCYYIDTVIYNGSIAQWCGLDFLYQTSNPLYYAPNLIVNNQLVANLVLPANLDTVKPYAFIGAGCIATLTIPNTVTHIGDYAFANCAGLDSLYLPNSVVAIGNHSFEKCEGLKTVKLSDSLTTIGAMAFAECTRLTSLIVPDAVATIGNGAFSMLPNIVYHGQATGSPWGALGVNLYYQDSLYFSDSTKTRVISSHKLITNAVLPNSVVEIRAEAFKNDSSLVSITLSDSLQTIGENAFLNCVSLSTIAIPRYVRKIDGEAFRKCMLKKVFFNADSCKVGKKDYRSYKEAFESIDTLVFGDSVRTILDSAFMNTTFSAISLSNSIKKIGLDAFSGSNRYVQVNYSGSLAQWCDIDFENVRSNPLGYSLSPGLCINGQLMRKVIIPDSVVVIKKHVFYNNSAIDTLIISNSVREIGANAFCQCISIKFLALSDSLERVGDGAFNNLYSLPKLLLPDKLLYIGYSAFYGCSKIDTVVVPDSVTYIGDGAFGRCSALKSLRIPCSVMYIGSNAFYGCSLLEDVVLCDSLSAVIGQYAFAGCPNLNSLDIPATVDTIGNSAFLKMPNVNYLGTATGAPWGALCLNCYLQDSLYYTDSTKNELRSSHRFITSAPIPNSVTVIGENAFNGRDSLKTISIPTNLSLIGSNAFSSTQLTSVVLPNTVDSMGGEVFMFCGKLRFVKLPDSLVEIGDGLFSYCGSLDSVVIPANVQKICDAAFNYCTSLSSIQLPESLLQIGANVFAYCHGLTSVVIPDNTLAVGRGAFTHCNGLERAVIGKSVIEIGLGAFYSCNNIDTIIFKPFTPPYYDFNIVAGAGTDTIYLVVPCSPQAIQNYWTALQTSSYARNRNFDVLGSDTVFTSLTVASNDNTMGTAQIVTPHSCPDYEAIISATANAGYHFVQWSDGNTDNPRTLIVTTDTLLVAEFQSGEGITESENDGISVSALAGRVVIQGVADEKVFVTDVLGRVIYNATVNERAEIAVKNRGIYFVKIGSRPAQKVVVSL